MPLAVHIEAYGCGTDARRVNVERVFENYGFRARIREDINFGPPPPAAGPEYLVITVVISAVTVFLTAFIGEAGKDAYQLFKRFLGDLGTARGVAPARMVLHDPIRQFEVFVAPDLPDDAYRSLFELDISAFPDRTLLDYAYDESGVGAWRAVGTLMSGGPGRPLMLFHPTFAATIARLSEVPSDDD